MVVVYLHVGQAGNEIGGAFWQLAASEKPTQRWLFDERGRCRCVLVDSEPKVVRGVVRAVGPERFHPRCALVEQSGRGNNWAMGYHGNRGSGDRGVADAALEVLRWQWERCDWCSGVVMTHSLGGGTGSGLGSLLLQELRDEHPRHYLTTLAISPFSTGELPLGAYNATLALSHLQEFSDAVLLFDGSQLLQHLQASRAGNSTSSRLPPRLCMPQIDHYLGRALAGVTFPTDGPGGRRPFDPGDLVTSTCPMPALKMLQLATTPTLAPHTDGGPTAASGGSRRPLATWGALVDECAERLPRYDLRQRMVSTLCSQAIARGVAGELPEPRAQARLQQLLGSSTSCPPDWRLSASAATALPASGAARTLTIVSNRSVAGAQLEQILLRSQLQLSSRAYLHHYERHGVSGEFIAEQIETVQRVVDDYASLARSITAGKSAS